MLQRKVLPGATRKPGSAASKPPPSSKPVSVDDVTDAHPSSEPRLLTPKDVAAHLGVSERTLETWRMNGEGPKFVKLTRKTVRYTPAAIDEFVRARVKENTAQ